MLRASLAVIVLGSAYVLLNMLRPARPEPAVAGPEELARARALIAGADATLANAALTGDKRLLFSDAGDAFVMYQIAGHSWIALGAWKFPHTHKNATRAVRCCGRWSANRAC